MKKVVDKLTKLFKLHEQNYPLELMS